MSQENSRASYHPSAVSLDGVNVLIISTGHAVTDPRIYAKQACSLQRLGANVTVVGKLEHGTPSEVRVLPVRAPSSRLVRFLWQPWRCLWTARWQRADIIHFHSAEILMTLPLARLWWLRSKFVYDVREDFAHLMLIRDWLPSWAKPVVRVLTNLAEKGLASFAHAIVGVTPPLTAKFGNQRKAVAYNYVSSEFFDKISQTKRKPQKREFDLVHLGTLNVRRARFLADTIYEFHQLRPDTRSLVIGIPTDIEEVMKARIPDGCTLLGRTPYKEIPGLLGNAKVGLDVHPWLGPHLLVALPVKVCEYMAAGCAVVSSGMPVLNNILAEVGADLESITIIEGGNPAEYAKAVVCLIQMIERGADPGCSLRQLALKHMVWEKEASKIAQLYLRLLGKPCAT